MLQMPKEFGAAGKLRRPIRQATLRCNVNHVTASGLQKHQVKPTLPVALRRNSSEARQQRVELTDSPRHSTKAAKTHHTESLRKPPEVFDRRSERHCAAIAARCADQNPTGNTEHTDMAHWQITANQSNQFATEFLHPQWGNGVLRHQHCLLRAVVHVYCHGTLRGIGT